MVAGVGVLLALIGDRPELEVGVSSAEGELRDIDEEGTEALGGSPGRPGVGFWAAVHQHPSGEFIDVACEHSQERPSVSVPAPCPCPSSSFCFYRVCVLRGVYSGRPVRCGRPCSRCHCLSWQTRAPEFVSNRNDT